MPAAFSRSMRSLAIDTFRPSLIGLVLAGLIIGAWTAWLLVARISICEISESARLEVESAAHPLASPEAGRVVATYLAVGKEVRAGDLLVELEAEPQRLSLQEGRAQVATVSPQIDALIEEVRAEERAQKQQRLSSQTSIAEARARYDEAESAAGFAQEEAERLGRLHAQGVLADLTFCSPSQPHGAQGEIDQRHHAHYEHA